MTGTDTINGAGGGEASVLAVARRLIGRLEDAFERKCDHDDAVDIAHEEIAAALAAPAAKGGTDIEVAGELTQGCSVSIDVSTCDEDAGHRVFGIIREVQHGGEGGRTFLAEYERHNFKGPIPTPPAGDDGGGESDLRDKVLEQARHQRDLMFATLHKVGVSIGVLNGSVACNGPQLIAAMEAYCDYLAKEPASDIQAAGGGESDLAALSAGATPGEWSVWAEKIMGAHDAIVELKEQVEQTRPIGDHLYLLSAGGKCPATTGCGPCSEANAAFIVALVNGYRSGRLIEAPAPEIRTQGEPVAWAWERYEPFEDYWLPVVAYAKPEESYRLRNIRPLYEAPAAPRSASPVTVEDIARTILDQRGFGFYTDPMEGGQDAYDISCEALNEAEAILALLQAPRPGGETGDGFATGQRVRKVRGSSWQGRVCGFYSTALTPDGICVESEREPGSVQIYPASALEPVAAQAHDAARSEGGE